MATNATLSLTILSPTPPHQEMRWTRPWPGEFPSYLEFLELSDTHALRINRDTYGIKGRCRLKNLRFINRNFGWGEDAVICLFPTFHVAAAPKDLDARQIEYLAGLVAILKETGWDLQIDKKREAIDYLKKVAAE